MSRLAGEVEHFRWRVLQDAIAEATAAYWVRRADTFAQVGTPRCDAIAEACLRHAQILRDVGIDDDTNALIAAAATAAGDP